jgi:periplasmic divalent cation tolerance protein
LTQATDFHGVKGVVILTTTPDILLAKRIAHVLIEEHLAACVQLMPPMLSVYEWRGEMQGDEEIGLSIKTSASASQQVIDRIVQLHPYEVPEVIVLPIIDGHAPYLAWLHQKAGN